MNKKMILSILSISILLIGGGCSITKATEYQTLEEAKK